MATTGTYTFTPEIAEIFEEAFERAGMAPQGIGGAHIRSALRSLKFMLNSEWSTIGVRQWMIDQGQETLSVGQTSFALPAGAIDVLHAVVRRNGQDIELDMVSRGDYLAIVDKHQKGRPDRYFVDRQDFVDRQASGPVMYIWQASENNTDVIVYDYFRQMQDVGEMTNTLQMPAYAYEACVSGLAYHLAVKFNPERAMGLRVAYGGAGYPARIDGGALERMRQEDRERGDLHLYAAIEPRSARR